MRAGTTGVTPPSSTSSDLIADGTAGWYYFGAAPTADPGAPTVSIYQGGYPSTHTQAKLYSDPTWFDVWGGSYATEADGITWRSSTEPKNTTGLTVEFITDAPDLFISFRYGISPARIAVDGKLVSPTAYYSNGGYNFRLMFPAGARKGRRITVMWPGSNHFYGVQLQPGDSVSKVTPTFAPYSLFTVGDSYFGGSPYHPCVSDRGPVHILAELLGAKQYQMDGVGGSGYITSGSGLPFGNTTRLARIPAAQDVIVVAGGINDPTTGLQTAVESYLTALRAAQPNAMVFVLGPWAGSSGPSATTLAKEAAISAAVAAVNDARITFVPVNTDSTGAWIQGTGRVSAPNNTGNADLYIAPDGSHPTCRGSEYLMGRLADAIRLKVAAL